MKDTYSYNDSREIKTGDAIRWMTINIINNFGADNSVFITLSLSGNNSLHQISKKFTRFVAYIGQAMDCAIAVFGNGERSLHVHIVGVFLPRTQNTSKRPVRRKDGIIHPFKPVTPVPIAKIRSLVKMAKAKAKFGRVFEVATIRDIEALGGYMRRNFLKFAEFRKFTDFYRRKKNKCVRLFKVPNFLRIKPSQFSRHTKAASRYRQAMTGLANAAGTPIGDLAALEQETGLSFKDLRHIAFGICNSTPGLPKYFPAKIFIRALNDAGCNIFHFKN